MTSFIRFMDVPGQLRIDGFAQSVGTAPYFFGFEINNEAVPLGCRPLPPNDPNGRFPFRFRPLVASQGSSCGALTHYYLWKRCGGEETISVDLSLRPGAAVGANVIYQGQLYVPTGEQTDLEPVTVTWTDQACEVWPVLALCTGGPFRLPYDPELRPSDGVTALWSGFRMVPVNETSSGSPVAVQWTTDPCPGSGGGGGDQSTDIGDAEEIPNDPRGSVADGGNEDRIRTHMNTVTGRCTECGG